jgi:potassium/hydrogen antiporter
VLPLVALGILVGPVFKLVTPSDLGQVGPIFTSLTLVILLFESGLGLDFFLLRDALKYALRLTALSFVGTCVVVTATSYLVLKLSFIEALLLGTILAGTSPATVIPLLSGIKLEERFKTALLVEPTLSDVLCIVLSLALLTIIKSNQVEPGVMVGGVIASFSLATIFGIVFAFIWSSILNRVRELENSIFTTAAFVSIVYGFVEFLGYSGPIAVFAFGIMLGNIHMVKASVAKYLPGFHAIPLNQSEKSFLNNTVFLLKTFFFVYLGMSVVVTDTTLLAAALVLTVWVFFIRIPVVLVATDKTVNRYEVAIASVMVSKGLAAAALASQLRTIGLSDGYMIEEVVYHVIVASIVINALLAYLINTGKMTGAYNFLFSKFPGNASPPPIEPGPAVAIVEN